MNTNRHSFGSYRLAVTKSYTQVALEMGNSPEKVRSNYNDPKAESEGAEYFAISRAAPENIITLPLALEFAWKRNSLLEAEFAWAKTAYGLEYTKDSERSLVTIEVTSPETI